MSTSPIGLPFRLSAHSGLPELRGIESDRVFSEGTAEASHPLSQCLASKPTRSYRVSTMNKTQDCCPPSYLTSSCHLDSLSYLSPHISWIPLCLPVKHPPCLPVKLLLHYGTGVTATNTSHLPTLTSTSASPVTSGYKSSPSLEIEREREKINLPQVWAGGQREGTCMEGLQREHEEGG